MVQYFVALVQSLMAREEEGQGMVEYALILVLVSIAAVALLRVLGTDVGGIFSDVSTELGGA